MSRIVIAFGGNALGKNPKEQQSLIKKAVKNVAPLIKEGHEIAEQVHNALELNFASVKHVMVHVNPAG